MVDVPGIKIGSGNAYVQDLVFVGESQIDIDFYEHAADTTKHTNTQEKDFWNSKLNVDESGLSSGNLIFTRN